MSDESIAASLAEMGITDTAAPSAPPPEPVTESAVEDRNPDGTFKARESNEDDALDDTATEAAADDGESESSEDQEKPPEPAPKPRNVSDRIGQLTAQRNEARAQVELLESRLRAYQPAEIDPNLEFEDPGKFTRETVKSALNEQRAQDDYQQVQAARQQHLKSSAEMFYERVETMRDELPDFDQVFNDRLPITDVAIEFLAESEVGPRIAHHLGKNPPLAQRIANLNPVQQAIELTRLEAKLSAAPAKRTTQAPKPASTIRAAASSGTFDPRTASIDDIARQIYGKG
jgi:hypothetical protein